MTRVDVANLQFLSFSLFSRREDTSMAEVRIGFHELTLSLAPSIDDLGFSIKHGTCLDQWKRKRGGNLLDVRSLASDELRSRLIFLSLDG
jgi:hypothetical protein